MDSVGGFHLEEIDGKLFMVYHSKYHPIPQTQSLNSSGEAASHDHPFQPLFVCPTSRWLKEHGKKFKSSPEYTLSPTKNDVDHPVLPLYWCNNKEFDIRGGCAICYGSEFGTNYYVCEYHDGAQYHKECVESPAKIKHPYHPQHSLEIFYHNPFDTHNANCLRCGKTARCFVYCCSSCQVFMHPICAMMPISFVIDKPKRHDHPLTFFPRQTSLTCNICGLLRKNDPTYVCLRCNFIAHKDCMYFPHIIKISRHHHRISYISSLRSGEWSCGGCRQSIDSDYGAYTCDKCIDYAVHSRCALQKEVWDGEELEGVPGEDDITQDVGPFDIISDGVILHFLHNHCLQLKISTLYDENKLCEACVLPIFEGNFYSCMKCDFILHETCAMAPRRIQHALHPHPFTLKTFDRFHCVDIWCHACNRPCGGFTYECYRRECKFKLDVRCALISEPFDYKAHEHPLFLASDQLQYPRCHVCKYNCRKQLNCIKCDLVVCFECATLPYKTRHKYDDHLLTLLCREEVCEKKDWCEVCERDFKDTKLYFCNECCTTFHTECVFGGDPYMKPGQFWNAWKQDRYY